MSLPLIGGIVSLFLRSTLHYNVRCELEKTVAAEENDDKRPANGPSHRGHHCFQSRHVESQRRAEEGQEGSRRSPREKSNRNHHERCELVKKKYLEECSERKRLYNEVIELKGNIRVFCRCRPLSQDEIANGSTSIVDFDSSQENELQIIFSDSLRKQFKFDHVFRPNDNQG
ncbi:unnamed protein product [Camellia sinensis]